MADGGCYSDESWKFCLFRLFVVFLGKLKELGWERYWRFEEIRVGVKISYLGECVCYLERVNVLGICVVVR